MKTPPRQPTNKPPRPNPPSARELKPIRPSSSTVIIDESHGSSGFWKTILFLIVIGMFAAGSYFYYAANKTTAPTQIVAEKKPTLGTIANPTGAPEPDKEVPVEKEDDAPPPTAPTTPVVEEKKPDPILEFPPLERRDSLLALQEATEARIKDGRWSEHQKQLRAAAGAAVNLRAISAGPQQLDALSAPGSLPLALAQLDLMTRLDNDTFAEWTHNNQPFATRLLTTPAMLELLVNNLAPEDITIRVLDIWKTLDAKTADPKDKVRYENLALALALVYDKGNRIDTAKAAYDYYVAADAKRSLYVDLTKIQPDELVFGVGDPFFGQSGMEWALKNFKFTAQHLGSAYPAVRYELNHPPYPEYTIENVMKMGGVCEQQAKVSQTNARARAVPAADIGGMGSRGGHAWFAYKTPRGWNNRTGRYNDGYACGHTSNPQTGQSMREWDLFLFDDPGRKNGDREASLRLMRAAKILATAKDTNGQIDLLEAAAYRNSGNPAPWRAYFLALLASKKDRSLEQWQTLVHDYRVALKNNPDFYDIADRVEIEKIFPKQDPDRVGEFLRNRRRQAMRDNPGRFDILVDSIQREADYYKTRNDTRRIGLLYNNAFREYGNHLPTFLALADNFSKDAAESPEIRRGALSVMEGVFNKQIDSDLKGDTFRLDMESSVCRKLASLYAKDDEKKSERYEKRASVIKAASKTKAAAM